MLNHAQAVGDENSSTNRINIKRWNGIMGSKFKMWVHKRDWKSVDVLRHKSKISKYVIPVINTQINAPKIPIFFQILWFWDCG